MPIGTTELRFPFARELQEQHEALRAVVRWLRAEVEGERPPGTPRGDARELLRVFRDQLVEHFRFEERNGFEGGIGSGDPEIRRWAQELAGQHRTFEGQLEALLARLDEPGSGPATALPLLTELRAFLGDLRRHDAEESALFLWLSRGSTGLARDSAFARHREGP